MTALTQIRIVAAPCPQGEDRALFFSFGQPYEQAKSQCGNIAPHIVLARPQALPAGSVLYSADGVPLFQVTGRVLTDLQTVPTPLLRALRPFLQVEEFTATISKVTLSLACITLSDKGYAGEREDRSGPTIAEMLRGALDIGLVRHCLLPDDPQALKALVLELASGQGFDLIVTCGGTGLSPRDLSPEALLPILDRRLPGMEQAMIMASLRKTPHAMLARLLAGTIGPSLVLALPGSVKAVLENLEAILPALPHALDKLRGQNSDCGG